MYSIGYLQNTQEKIYIFENDGYFDRKSGKKPSEINYLDKMKKKKKNTLRLFYLGKKNISTFLSRYKIVRIMHNTVNTHKRFTSISIIRPIKMFAVKSGKP